MEKVVKIVSFDYEYWISRKISERLKAIEILRKKYIQFIKDAEPRPQRVCRLLNKNYLNIRLNCYES